MATLIVDILCWNSDPFRFSPMNSFLRMVDSGFICVILYLILHGFNDAVCQIHVSMLIIILISVFTALPPPPQRDEPTFVPGMSVVHN